MTPMRCLQITAAAFALHVLLLPACVQWNMGERIRESAETRVGADVTQRFVCAETQQTLAPEVTYRAETPLITFLREDEDPAAREVTPTGQLRVVSLPRVKGLSYFLPRRARTTVHERWTGNPHPAREEDAVPLGYSPTADNARWLGTAERRREEDYALKAALAAPFDYCLDPVLSTASSIIVVPVIAPVLLWGIAYDIIRY